MARKLRTGFTTGTAAAAAAKAALLCLFENKRPSEVDIALLTGDPIRIPVHTVSGENSRTAIATIIKDAGDDPDITNNAEIGAKVTVSEAVAPSEMIEIIGGKGVGVVTKPGLEVLPGEPAINPGPRKMISQSVNDVLAGREETYRVTVEVFVPEGERLARKTLNARLGILNGISILGTTGLVKPLSHSAYTATIESAISVAEATGNDRLIFTTGRRSERFAQALWPKVPEEAFIQIGDFFKASIEMALKKDIQSITLAVFFGKAVKMAQGIPHTHAAKAPLTLTRLSEWSYGVTKDKQFAEDILESNTARHAFDKINAKYPDIVGEVGRRIVRSAKKLATFDIHVQSVIFDYGGKIVFDSDSK